MSKQYDQDGTYDSHGPLAIETYADPEVEVDLRKQITRLFGEMPYGGLCNFRRPAPGDRDQIMTLAQVVDNLTSLRDVLRRVAEDDHAQEQEYRQLKADLAAVRRLITGLLPS